MNTEISKLVEPFNILINLVKQRLNVLITNELDTIITKDAITAKDVVLDSSHIENIKSTIDVLTYLYKEKYEIYRQIL